MPTEPELVIEEVASIFNSLGVEYLVGGSVASSIHGVPRMTNDVDMVADIGAEHVRPLVAALRGRYYLDESAIGEAIAAHGTFNIIHLATMLRIDVFIRQRTLWANEEWRRRLTARLGSDPDSPAATVSSAEDTILQKLQWYRMGGHVSERQWRDVVGIISIRGDELDHEYLREWATRLGLSDLLAQARADAQKPGLGD